MGVVPQCVSTAPWWEYSHNVAELPHCPSAPFGYCFILKVIVCVGLAQNFAALRALSSEGIQKGHMALHAQNIAIAGKKKVTK